MLRVTPLRARRKHKPIAVQRHHARVGSLPCLVSGQYGVTLHHVTGYADRDGRFSRDDWLVVPLAPEYHLIQFGPRGSVEALGHQGFFETYGIDLLAEAQRLKDWSLEMEARAA
jgi:hypothetical protein